MASTRLDFERPGLQAGCIDVPCSVDESAWRNLRIPLHVIGGTRPGPTVLLLGGIHGDEYEGPVALSWLVRTLAPEDVAGRLIVVPAVNLAAVLAGTRLTPMDGENLNRVFPGDPRGSLTRRLAHWITTALVARADVVVDLHSGGRSLRFLPSVFVHEQADAANTRRHLAAARAFAAPLTVVLREPHADVMIDAVVEAQGKLMIATELGGGGMLTPETIHIARSGLERLLAHIGVLDSPSAGTTTDGAGRIACVPGPDHYVHADDLGVFEPVHEVGQPVSPGGLVGYLHRVDRFDRAPCPVHTKTGGLLICRHGQGLARRDDVLAVFADDYAAD